MAQQANLDNLHEWEKFVVVTFDEMKIKEGLVYNKYTNSLVGFTSLDNVSDHLNEFERDVRENRLKHPVWPHICLSSSLRCLH